MTKCPICQEGLPGLHVCQNINEQNIEDLAKIIENILDIIFASTATKPKFYYESKKRLKMIYE